MKYSLNLGKSGLVILLLGVIFVVLISFVVLNKSATPDNQPPNVSDELRGGRFLIIRLPQSVQPLQEIQIFEDGIAGRVHVLYAPNNVGQKVQLSQIERVQISNIRTQWCRAIPKFRQIQSQEDFYDIGLLCDYESRRIEIPLDRLPPELVALLERIPKLNP